MKTAPFAISTLCLMLSACGGGSNTITNSLTGSNAQTNGAPVLCAATDVSCVDVVLDDTPVVNVNFECGNGKYYGVTNNTGVARCPIDSTISYFVKSASGARKISLGSFSIKSVRSTTAADAQEASLIRIGVKELAENITASSMSSLDDNSAAAKTAINLSRVLQSLRLKSEPYIDTAPVNRVFIDNALKQGLDSLKEDITTKDFTDQSYESKIAPVLQAQGIALISLDEARRRLQKTILATKAGNLFSNPNMSLGGTDNNLLGFSGVDLGISGKNSSDQRASVALFSVTDRSGVTSAYGLHWTAKVDTAQNASTSAAYNAYTMFLKNDFAKMSLASAGGIDPYTNRFKDFSLRIGQKPFNPDAAANPYQGNLFRLVNGKLVRNFAVIGTENIYKLYMGVGKIEDVSELGTWTQTTASGIDNFAGNATVFKSGAVNSFLDPAVWRTKDSIRLNAGYKTYVFPLYVTLKISPAANIKEVCQRLGVASCSEQTHTLPIAFMENGDILTDAASDTAYANAPAVCGRTVQVDATGKPVLDATGQPMALKQVRIGTVRAAYPSTDNTQFFISPSILAAGDRFGALDGLQIGTGSIAPRVKFNLAGVINAAAGQKGNVNVTSAEGGAIYTDGGAANWVNGYNAFTFQRVTTKLSEADSVPAAERAAPVTEAQKLAATQDLGLLTAVVSDCYTVKSAN